MKPSAVASAPSSRCKEDQISAAGAGRWQWPLLLPLATFVLTLCFSFGQHFWLPEQRVTFFSDSAHYLESCRNVVQLFLAASAGHAFAELNGKLCENLLLDGPVLPLLSSAYFLALKHVPSAVDWQPFVIVESLCHATAAALVSLLAQRLCPNRLWSGLAGLAWGLYPAALVATGRFLTEIPAVTILLLLTWQAAKTVEQKGRSSGQSLLTGIFTGLLLLVKPALSPAGLAVDLLALASTPGYLCKFLVAAFMFCGLLLPVGAWGIYTKVSTNTVYLIPQRVPVYNAVKGVDTEADGWESMPHPPLTQLMFNAPSVGQAMLTGWLSHPGRLALLFLRKVSRLWALPWNDFRQDCLGLPLRHQVIGHLIIWALAIQGMLAVICHWPRPLSGDTRSFVGWSCLLAIGGHLAYVPFESIGRYGFTAMPFVFILAFFALSLCQSLKTAAMVAACVLTSITAAEIGASQLGPFVSLFPGFREAGMVRLLCQIFLIALAAFFAALYANKLQKTTPQVFVIQNQSRLSIGVAIATGAILAAASAAAFFIDGRLDRQWSLTLEKGQAACRQIAIPAGAAARKPQLSAVLIDGNAQLSGARITVNGHVIAEQPELLYRRKPSRYFLFDVMRTCASKLGFPVSELRQWRVVTFPAEWLVVPGANTITLTNASDKPLILYGDYDDTWQSRSQLPDLDYFSVALLLNAASDTEARLLDPVGCARAQSKSWWIAGGISHLDDLSGEAGKQIGQYRLLLAIDYAGGLEAGSGKHFAGRAKTYQVRLTPDMFDPLIGTTLVPDAQFRINKAIMKAASRLDAQIPIPSEASQFPFLKVKISGYIRAGNAPGTASILPILVSAGRQPETMILSATPPGIHAERQWTPFEIDDLVPTNRFENGLAAISLAFFPGRWEEVWQYGVDRRCGDACFKDVTIEFQPVSAPALPDKHLALF